MKNNWLKMYDKLGQILRIETVINQPGEFKVFRACQHRDGTHPPIGIPCAKALAIYVTIKATLWHATNDTWKPWRWWTIRRRASTI